MVHYNLVVNPNSGNGKTGKKWPQYEKTFRSILGDDLEIRFTEEPGQGYDLTKDFLQEGAENILSCGGDGTHNEVGNALIGTEIPMGLISLGNSNDHPKGHKIPLDLEGALNVVKNGRTGRFGVGKLDDGDHSRYFLDLTDVGVSSKPAKAAHYEAKWLKGDMKYTYLVLKYLLKHQNIPMTITVDGEQELQRDVTILAAGMAEIITGFKLLPDNSHEFGNLGVLIAHGFKRHQIPGLMISASKGTHIKRPNVDYFRATRLDLEADELLIFEAEGEIWESDKGKVTIQYYPDAVTKFIP